MNENPPRTESKSDRSENRYLTPIIDAATTVHREMGPGFVKAIYEQALAVEMDFRRIRYERQKAVDVFYHGKRVGEHRLSFLVEGMVVVELEAETSSSRSLIASARSYLKAAQTPVGLVFNFGTETLSVERVTVPAVPPPAPKA